MSEYHQSVLLQSICTLLAVSKGKKYIDATCGGGGHAVEIAARGGQVLGLDQDPDAVKYCSRFPQITCVKGNFIHLEEIAGSHQWKPVHGILFDLGVSWHQLATPGRGFSFQTSGPLDMRMDPELPNSAETLINQLSKNQLAEILTRFGEVSNAGKIAEKIVAHRPLTDTLSLAAILGSRDLSRKVFQALRIAVNDELTAITVALPQALSLLEKGGRIAVISFHSLEDRLVKDQFSDWSGQGLGKAVTPEAVTPSREEMLENPKSKSAKLRVFEKI